MTGTTLVAWLVLIVLAVASAVGVVYARHESRQAFQELTRLEQQRDELNIEFGRLKIEQATSADTNRVEQIATVQLGMVFPLPVDTRVIRR